MSIKSAFDNIVKIITQEAPCVSKKANEWVTAERFLISRRSYRMRKESDFPHSQAVFLCFKIILLSCTSAYISSRGITHRWCLLRSSSFTAHFIVNATPMLPWSVGPRIRCQNITKNAFSYLQSVFVCCLQSASWVFV